MNAIELAISRLERIRDNVEIIAIEEYSKREEKLSELNRNRLASGIDANGNDMVAYVGASKSPSAPGNVKLFDTGSYHEGIKTIVESGFITAISTDSKFSFLDKKYPTALGVSMESIEAIREEVNRSIVKRIMQL